MILLKSFVIVLFSEPSHQMVNLFFVDNCIPRAVAAEFRRHILVYAVDIRVCTLNIADGISIIGDTAIKASVISSPDVQRIIRIVGSGKSEIRIGRRRPAVTDVSAVLGLDDVQVGLIIRRIIITHDIRICGNVGRIIGIAFIRHRICPRV